MNDYAALVEKLEKIKAQIPARLQDAYFELVEYPVKGAAAMNVKILKERMARVAMLSAQKSIAIDSSQVYEQQSRKAYKEILALTHIYNKVVAQGKWDGMMGISPRWRPEFKAPFDDSTKVKQEPTVYEIPRKESIVVKALQYVAKTPSVEEIKGLGVTGGAVAVYDMMEDTPYVEYEIPVKKGDNAITVMCVPSFPLNKDYQLRYIISIDGSKSETKKVDAEVGSDVWSKNVLLGYTTKATTSHYVAKQDGKVLVRVGMLAPGLAIQGIKVGE